jgi:hypothetical protein
MAPKESCPTKTALLADWQKATVAYSKAVSELLRRIGTVSTTEYEKLSQNAEAARKRSLEAKANLEVHGRVHGCEDQGEAVA